MTDGSYRKALDDLKAERGKLVAQREEIDHRLARVDAAIANLAVVLDNEPFEGGLTEAVRAVLQRGMGRPYAPTEVRDGLKAIGYDASHHTNLMASVHSVLKRLAETPNVEALKSSAEGGFRYRWRRAPQPNAEALKRLTEELMRSADLSKSIKDQRLQALMDLLKK